MKRLKSILDVSATVLVIVAAGFVIWRQMAPGSRPPGSRPRVEEATGTLSSELATSTRGSGQIALVEFADFECPFCGRHAREVEPMIRKAFVDTGVVREVFVNLPLPIHSHAGPASEAAVCAGNQGKFWEMYDALFTDQKALAAADLKDRASKIGLDKASFEECLERGDARPVIKRHQDAAQSMKVQATPAFFIGLVQSDGSILLKRRLNGALPFAEFKTALADLTPKELKSKISEITAATVGLFQPPSVHVDQLPRHFVTFAGRRALSVQR
jgi:protein-disulfide isomerase